LPLFSSSLEQVINDCGGECDEGEEGGEVLALTIVLFIFVVFKEHNNIYVMVFIL
jgi:hypothetical protein